ncbi:4-hydroxyproline epimerase [Roseateles sp. BYS180W]|uniref:4-hydroxyproline epimerase n=1 Tax=Roseateles rivi TaxID=3299028 RepID=A0ABW7FWU5_9BURK
MQRIEVIDSHTGGEPTRLVVAGFPDLGTGSMAQRRALLAQQHDAWRRATVLEPRGSDVVVGALLCAPENPAHAAGVIFFNNEGYLGMCGHGTMGVVASLAYLGRLGCGEHTLETPVGPVRCTLHEDGSVSVRNVPAYRLHADVALRLPSGQTVHGDVAWGGNWFFLCSDHGQRVGRAHVAELTAYCLQLRQALREQGVCGADGAEIDHIELFAPPQGDEDQAADSRNFVLCPGGAYDRSPCGTGTSAKLACLAARGSLAPQQRWCQASVIGSCFEAWYETHEQPGWVVPTLRGRAHVCAQAQLLIDPTDRLGWGIV